MKFRVLFGVLRKICLEKYIKRFFLRVCKYLNQRVRRIGEKNGKSFKSFLKKRKKDKKTHGEIEFHN